MGAETNAAVEALKAAEQGLTSARSERGELAKLREKLAHRHTDLSTQRVAASTRLNELTLATLRDDSAPGDLAPHREALAKLTVEIDELEGAIGALDGQLTEAEAVHGAAVQNARAVQIGVARALAPKLQDEIRVKMRDVCRLQYKWGVIAKTGELPYTGTYSLHADPDPTKESSRLDAIALTEGIRLESFYLRNAPLDLTATELIELASERDDLTFEPTAAAFPVAVDYETRSLLLNIDDRGFNALPDDG